MSYLKPAVLYLCTILKEGGSMFGFSIISLVCGSLTNCDQRRYEGYLIGTLDGILGWSSSGW